MANKGGSYGQDMPEGVKRHRIMLKEMAEAAKARRQAKARKKLAEKSKSEN